MNKRPVFVLCVLCSLLMVLAGQPGPAQEPGPADAPNGPDAPADAPLTWETFDEERYERISLEIVANFDRGQSFFERREYEQALEHFEKNLPHRRQIEFAAENLYSVGETGHPSIRSEDADEYYAYYDSVYRIATIRYRLDELDAAVPGFETLVGRFPLWEHGYHGLAETYRGLDRPGEAAAVYQRMVESYARISQRYHLPEMAYREIALLSLESGELEKAVEAGTAAARIVDPARGHAVLIGAFAAARRGDDGTAFGLIAEGLSVLTDEQLQSFRWFGRHQERFGDAAAAGEIDPVLGRFAVWAVDKKAGTEEDRAAALEALEALNGPDAGAAGRVSGELTEALEGLNAGAPFDPYGAALLACLFARRGDADRAVEFLKRASGGSLAIARALAAADEDLASLRSVRLEEIFPPQSAESPPDYEAIAEEADVELVVQNWALPGDHGSGPEPR